MNNLPYLLLSDDVSVHHNVCYCYPVASDAPVLYVRVGLTCMAEIERLPNFPGISKTTPNL